MVASVSLSNEGKSLLRDLAKHVANIAALPEQMEKAEQPVWSVCLR